MSDSPLSPLPPLSLLESRVLGVLVEKERTVPDTYPLSLNALTAGCNQKTSRNPVIEATEAQVLAALDTLRRHSLVIESSGSRTMRYSHNVKRVFGLPSQSVALLAMLALRGPQTAAELRANCERLERFADASSVEGFLDEMAARPQGPLVRLLPRQPGAREARWAHLLGGAPDEQSQAGEARVAAAGVEPATGGTWVAGSAPMAASAGAASVEARLSRLEREVAELREMLAALEKGR
ncbi:YceH family protein [Burkholderiaceae bacterium FT117]|uniref:YceH family protein n=1 Tax=Zeimonas sediminis TaxID=2944268 RepID=UPI002342EE85|nr:YceH family protein [Zeimonas sediminis]MCM5571115.1 YceH family protein [Zeimonas sediminis]